MNIYIAFLRGINVSGKNIIKMDVLKQVLINKGYTQVQTYIQSGNVIFKSETSIITDIETSFSSILKTNFGFEVPVIVIRFSELEKLILNNPFTNKSTDNLYVTLFNQEPSRENLSKLDSYLSSEEQYLINNQVLYLYNPTGYSKTKLNNNLIEKQLNLIATTRNWRTIISIHSLCTA